MKETSRKKEVKEKFKEYLRLIKIRDEANECLKKLKISNCVLRLESNGKIFINFHCVVSTHCMEIHQLFHLHLLMKRFLENK